MKKTLIPIISAAMLLVMMLIPQTGFASGGYTQDEINVAKIMEREAGSSVEGRYAVATVIMNRLNDPIWNSSSISDVIFRKGQFPIYNQSAWDNAKPSKQTLKMAREVINGKRTLPSYVEYFKNSQGKKKNGLYYWGSHVFYKKIGGNYFFFNNKTCYDAWSASSGSSKKAGTTSSKKTYSASGGLYTVKAGDSLYAIAKSNGTTIQNIRLLNGLASNFIYPGQKLVVSTVKKSYSSSGTSASSDTYTVKAGDSLYVIARKFGTTISAIQQLNGLKNYFIYPGQVLKVQNSASYTVKAGDSLYVIAKKYGTTIKKIQELNGLKDYFIYPNQTLKVPVSGSSVSSGKVYTVEHGDSLYVIAKRNNKTIDQIKSLNGLKSNFIFPGQKLRVG